MRFLLLFIFIITTLFGSCNSLSLSKTYQIYSTAKQDYIKAILDENRNKKVIALKKIVDCGKVLGFNVSKYEIQLKKLTNKKVKKNTPHKYKPIKNPLKLESKYIKVISYNPLKIKLNSKMRVKYLTLNRKGKLYKIFDIYNAKINRKISKKITQNIYLIAAQNMPNKVRVVLYSRKKFKIKYSNKHKYLNITLFDKSIPKYTKMPKIKEKLKKYKQKIIVIDPGHGGKDYGGIANGVREKDIVLRIGLYLRDELKRRGYKVYMTRYGDYFVKLSTRTKFANRHNADLFISLHCNIFRDNPNIKGVTTYYLSPARTKRAERVAKLENSAFRELKSINQKVVLNFLNKNRIIQSDKMAMDIQRNIIFNLRKYYKNIEDRGVRPAPFWVLVGTQMPSILLETGFLTNKMEAKRLKNRSYQKRYAKAIADGIESYLIKNQ